MVWGGLSPCQSEPFLHTAPGSEAYQCVSLLISENKNYDSIIYVKIQLYGDDLLVIFPYKYMVGS